MYQLHMFLLDTGAVQQYLCETASGPHPGSFLLTLLSPSLSLSMLGTLGIVGQKSRGGDALNETQECYQQYNARDSLPLVAGISYHMRRPKSP